MFAILLLVAMTPFFLLKDWRTFTNGSDYRLMEIQRSANGFSMAVISGIALTMIPDVLYGLGIAATQSNRHIAIGIGLFVCVLGAFWFFTGYARSHGYPDGRAIGFSVAEVAFGCILLWALVGGNGPLVPYVQGWSWLADLGFFVFLWCVLTGGIKIWLLRRGPPGFDVTHPPADMPYGKAPFGSGKGLW
jgi:hypothetical protein